MIALTSALTAPDSIRFFWMGLKSRPRTGPVCLLLEKIFAFSALDVQLGRFLAVSTHPAPFIIFSGLKTLISPVSIPAAKTPLV